MIRMAKTKPDVMPGWNSVSLPISSINLAWTAAQLFFGSLWKHTSVTFSTIPPLTIRVDQLSSPISQMTKDQQSSTTDKAKLNLTDSSQVLTSNDGLLKPPHQSITTGLPKDSESLPTARKQDLFDIKPMKSRPMIRKKKKAPLCRSFLTLQLPIQVADITKYNQTFDLVVTSIHALWKALLQVDMQGSSIEPWDTPDPKPPHPITFSKDLPASKLKLFRYVDHFRVAWATSNDTTNVRFILGHSRPIEEYTNNLSVQRKAEDLEAELTFDRIQSSRKAVAGYLAGPILLEQTCDNLAELILKLPIFIANKISELEIAEEVISIYSTVKKFSRLTKKTRAMHVCVPHANKAIARACLASVFPSKTRKEYPLGIQFRFVPNTADIDFTVPPKARTIAGRLKNKQACLMDNTIKRENSHIKNILSIFPSKQQINLLKILMYWKSNKYPGRFMFTCVEQPWEDGPVYFQYLTEMENEVDSMLPSLPLIIQEVYGDESKRWFKPSASIGCEGLSYDKETRKIIPTKYNVYEQLNEDWNVNTGNSDDESWSDVSDDGHGGFAIDIGEIDIDNTHNRASLLDDDNGSLGTLGLGRPPGFVDTDMLIEEDVCDTEMEDEDKDADNPKQASNSSGNEINILLDTAEFTDNMIASLMKNSKLMETLTKNISLPNNTASPKQGGVGRLS